jgi:8-oxo-dGTP diphosphatase
MSNFPSVVCTVDVVLLGLQDSHLSVLLHRREREPFAGVWTLPGGFIHPEEDVSCEASARRVLRQKTGLEGLYLEQLACFSGPARDPRGWSLSLAFVALTSSLPLADAGQKWVRSDQLDPLPFDHGQIVTTALERVRNKSHYSSLAALLCPEPFTLPELHAIYETLLGEDINPVSFRRKMDELGILEAVPGSKKALGAHRPAQLYRLKTQYRQRLSLVDRGLNS